MSVGAKMRRAASGLVVPGGGFSPLDIPSLVVWADASDDATITDDGTNLTGWLDKSGNGNHAVLGVIPASVYGTRTIGGLNVLDLTSHAIQFPFTAGAVAEDTTVFFVFQRDSGNGQLFDIRNSGNATPLHDDLAVCGFGARRRNDGNSIRNTGSATQDTVPHVYTYRSEDLATFEAYLEGTVIGTPNDAVGVMSGLNQFFVAKGTNCAVGEAILCSAALSTADRGEVETYLTNKWGI